MSSHVRIRWEGRDIEKKSILHPLVRASAHARRYDPMLPGQVASFHLCSACAGNKLVIEKDVIRFRDAGVRVRKGSGPEPDRTEPRVRFGFGFGFGWIPIFSGGPVRGSPWAGPFMDQVRTGPHLEPRFLGHTTSCQ